MLDTNWCVWETQSLKLESYVFEAGTQWPLQSGGVDRGFRQVQGTRSWNHSYKTLHCKCTRTLSCIASIKVTQEAFISLQHFVTFPQAIMIWSMYRGTSSDATNAEELRSYTDNAGEDVLGFFFNSYHWFLLSDDQAGSPLDPFDLTLGDPEALDRVRHDQNRSRAASRLVFHSLFNWLMKFKWNILLPDLKWRNNKIRQACMR